MRFWGAAFLLDCGFRAVVDGVFYIYSACAALLVDGIFLVDRRLLPCSGSVGGTEGLGSQGEGEGLLTRPCQVPPACTTSVSKRTNKPRRASSAAGAQPTSCGASPLEAPSKSGRTPCLMRSSPYIGTSLRPKYILYKCMEPLGDSFREGPHMLPLWS